MWKACALKSAPPYTPRHPDAAKRKDLNASMTRSARPVQADRPLARPVQTERPLARLSAEHIHLRIVDITPSKAKGRNVLFAIGEVCL